MIEMVYASDLIEIFVIEDDDEDCGFEHYDNESLNECDCFN